LQSAITSAVSAGTLSAGTTATINAHGQLSIATNSSATGIVVNSNDEALGSMTAVASTKVANAYAYVGNSNVNSVQVGDSLNVATNISGSQLLTSGSNAIASLTGLITALQSGTSTDIGTATAAVSAALSAVGQQRIPLDNTISQLNSQESYLSQETLTLTTAQTSLVGANIADAATNLSNAEIDNSAVLAAAAKAMPENLLKYLQ
jgi:flagellin-like hook-associated protein FlgL